jgi:predicted DCC family thiol-disulfide oxidoreductase YuxK
MTTIEAASPAAAAVPILLFDGTCKVCRRLAHWVQASVPTRAGTPTLIVRPVGDDPQALQALHPGLDIWAAYRTVHVLMPDGSMMLGGEAIAEILRRLPNAQWFAWSFGFRLFGVRPVQALLDAAYVLLDDVRPLLGCESCGTPSFFVGKIAWLMQLPKTGFGGGHRPAPHLTARRATQQPNPIAKQP